MSFKLLSYERFTEKFSYVYFNIERRLYYVDGERAILGRLVHFELGRQYKPMHSHQKQLFKEDLVDFINKAYEIKLE